MNAALPSSPEQAIDEGTWGGKPESSGCYYCEAYQWLGENICGHTEEERSRAFPGVPTAKPKNQFDIIASASVESDQARLGMMSGFGWAEDPKRLVFNAARYKFVAKMLEGKDRVLEVGCADAFFSRIVRQHVKTLVAVDTNYAYIGSAKKIRSPKWHIFLNSWDILDGPLAPSEKFDAVYCLDLFEHIAEEDVLLGNLAKCAPVCIVGIPSLESQAHASEISKAEHVNCKTKDGLRVAMQRHFKQVFMFGMNDETLHTGVMAAYLFALGVNP